MKKKIFFALIPIVVIGIIGFTIYKDALKTIKHPFVTKDEAIEIKVSKGDTLNSVINSLYENKKIGNLLLVKWYIKNQKLDTNIKPGTYKLSKDTSLDNLVKSLGEGNYNENAIKVTIPEGYTIDAMASLLQEKGVISKDEFLNSCKTYPLPDYVKKDPSRKYALEGFLFPNTYEFIKGSKGKDIIDIMVKNFDNTIKDIEKKTGKNIDKAEIDKVITMASIVEREAEQAEERPIVASVFYNRQKINMKMESCATVEYALGIHKTIYTYKDIETPSPYNTYIVSGLPVGPICNPGRDSIVAALQPEQTKYLFFVSKFDGTGKHFFSENYEKFTQDTKISNANLEKMKK